MFNFLTHNVTDLCGLVERHYLDAIERALDAQRRRRIAEFVAAGRPSYASDYDSDY